LSKDDTRDRGLHAYRFIPEDVAEPMITFKNIKKDFFYPQLVRLYPTIAL
jgi:hypothetical protein